MIVSCIKLEKKLIRQFEIVTKKDTACAFSKNTKGLKLSVSIGALQSISAKNPITSILLLALRSNF